MFIGRIPKLVVCKIQNSEKDMEESPFFGGYLIKTFFEEDEKDYDVFLTKEGKILAPNQAVA